MLEFPVRSSCWKFPSVFTCRYTLLDLTDKGSFMKYLNVFCLLSTYIAPIKHGKEGADRVTV